MLVLLVSGTDVALATVGAGIAILGGAIGTGIAQSAIGAAGLGLIAEKPEEFGRAIVFLVIPETLIIFGFIVAYLILHAFGII